MTRTDRSAQPAAARPVPAEPAPAAPPAQMSLPGQSHTAEGPHDLSGMYLMHHAFRRDLDRFVPAVRATPVGDDPTWTALHARWLRFAEVLHHHHVLEDEWIWPPLVESAEAAGRHEDAATLRSMEAEHETVDPALERCTAAFAEMAAHPCEDHRNALDVRMTAVRELLAAHLAHEETGALPLVQSTMTAAQWAASEKAAEKGYPVRMLPFLLVWVDDALPPDARARLRADAGPVLGVVLRLASPWHQRKERRTFRHAARAL